MVNGIITIYTRGINKGSGSKFLEGSRLRHEGSRVRLEKPEEGRRAYRPKRCVYDNKDGDNSPKTPNSTINVCSS